MTAGAHPGHGGPGHRAAAAFGAATTALVAVGADVLGGGRPEHTVTLAVVAAAVMVVRLGMVGRNGGLFRAVSAALVAQPALHAATKLLPAATEPASAGVHTAADASATVLHVLVAFFIVTSVAAAEHVFLLLVALGGFARWLVLLPRAMRPGWPAILLPAPSGAVDCRWSAATPVAERAPPGGVRAAV